MTDKMKSLLWGVDAADLATSFTVCAVLICAIVVACYIPPRGQPGFDRWRRCARS